jgi:branched-chain amino acid transport system substrate-binding protein
MRAVRRIASFLVLAGLLAAPLPGPAAEPFAINAILPLTGAGAFLGKAEADTLALVTDVVNRSGGVRGRPIRFAIQDDQSNPQVAVQLASALIASNVPVIIGPALAGMCNAVAPLAKDGPVVYCLSPGIRPAAGGYVFSASIATADALGASAVYFHDRGWRKIAVMTSTDATGQDGERAIVAAFSAAAGEEIVANEHFNIGDISVGAQMARIKSSDAQALIAWGTGTPIATVLRGIAETGFERPVMLGNGNVTYAQMKAYASFLPRELYFPVPPAVAPNQLPDGGVKRAVARYMSAWAAIGQRPDIGPAAPWDSAFLIVEAFRRLGLDANAAQIRAYLAGVRNWPGVDGTFDFRAVPQRGLDVNSVVIVRWDQAQEAWVGVSKYGGHPL